VETVQRWADETPDDFDFIVKVHGDTTHKREGSGEEIEELMTSLSPLVNTDKLKGLLAQFPASFHFNSVAQDYLEKLVQYGHNVPIFTEFRHSSWDCAEAVDFVREKNFGWVVVDLPPIRSLPGIRPASTNSMGYVRFHGRNATTWYNQDKGNRCDWNYEAEYLKKWIIRLKAITGYAEMTYLFFNNCHAGQAVKNALLMREILSQEFKIVS
jgi:uncharacterized protein YecE (DUF72 family)